MSNHIVLARKYRPQTLSDITGQDVLVQTIRRALILKRLPQAVLLTGTRGIGKTTTARIIAKYLNCQEIISGKATDCCNRCDSCISIANCSHPDVLEFDAASKTSVNDIREIIEGIQYSPIKSPNKFYIIDEVHMLSNSAFNALLKTLEEPPAHVRFILATTEENKIPLTIISRCLQFRLRPIKYQTIARRCNDILYEEGYEAEEGVTDMIAKSAKGSMRDALSILEGALVFCTEDGKRLLMSNLMSLLGNEHYNAIEKGFQDLCTGDLKGCLKVLGDLYDFGLDPLVIITNILNLVHEMAIKEISGELCGVQMPFILYAWQVLSDALEKMKSSDDQMMSLEMAIIKLAHINTEGSNEIDSDEIPKAIETSPPRQGAEYH